LADRSAPQIAEWYGRWLMSYLYVLYKRDFDPALVERETALAIESLRDAKRAGLDMPSYDRFLEWASYQKGQYQDAMDQLEQAPPWVETNRMLAATFVQVWHGDRAEAATTEILNKDWSLSFARLRNELVFGIPRDGEPLIAGLGEASLPPGEAPRLQVTSPAGIQPGAAPGAESKDAPSHVPKAEELIVSQSVPGGAEGARSLEEQLETALEEAQADQEAAEASAAELRATLAEALAGRQAAEASAAESAALGQQLKAASEEIERLSAAAEVSSGDAARLGEELSAARQEGDRLKTALDEALDGRQAAEASAAEAAALGRRLETAREEMKEEMSQEIERLSAVAEVSSGDAARLGEELSAARREGDRLKTALDEALAGRQAAEASAAEAGALRQQLEAASEEMRQEIERLSAAADVSNSDAARLGEELSAARQEGDRLKTALDEALAGRQAAEASAAEAAALGRQLETAREEMKQEMKQEIETLTAAIGRDLDTLLNSLDEKVAALEIRNQALEETLTAVNSERGPSPEILTDSDTRRGDPGEGKLAKPEATPPKTEVAAAATPATKSSQIAAKGKAVTTPGPDGTGQPATSGRAPPSPGRAEATPASQGAGSAGGDYAVQLASYKSTKRARTGWATLQGSFPALLGDRTLAMQRVDLGDRGVFHRVLATPFATRAQARALCAQLKAKEQYCLVRKRGQGQW
jgi:hypothetical protein